MSVIQRFQLFASSLLWLVGAAEMCTCNGNSGIRKHQEFAGITVNLLGIKWGWGLLEDGMARWEKETGGRIVATKADSVAELEPRVSDDLMGARFFDGYICTNKMVPMWASRGLLADLSESVRTLGTGWTDILPIFRELISTYDQKVVSIPWDGDMMLTYFRRDLADADGWTAPKTWEEFVAIAERYDAQDLNEDGVSDYGACMCSDATEPTTFYHWIAPLLTMTQYTGTMQGAFLHLTDEGIEPLVNNEAFRRGIEYLRRAQGSYPVGVGQTYGKARSDFANGRCAIYITWPSGGPWSIKKDTNGQYPYVHGRMGVANIPGSPVVLNRRTGKLVKCAPETCLHAVDPVTGVYDGINKIAWYANGGMSVVVNEASTRERKEAIINFFLWYSQQVDVTRPSPYNPFRKHDFNVSDYIASGWDAGDAQQYVDAELEVLTSKYSRNAVLDFRVPFASEFFQSYNALYPQLLAGTVSVANIHTRVHDFIHTYFGNNIQDPILPGELELERIYRTSLGLRMRPTYSQCAPGSGYVETNVNLQTGECRRCSSGMYSPGGKNQRCLPCKTWHVDFLTAKADCTPWVYLGSCLLSSFAGAFLLFSNLRRRIRILDVSPTHRIGAHRSSSGPVLVLTTFGAHRMHTWAGKLTAMDMIGTGNYYLDKHKCFNVKVLDELQLELSSPFDSQIVDTINTSMGICVARFPWDFLNSVMRIGKLVIPVPAISLMLFVLAGLMIPLGNLSLVAVALVFFTGIALAGVARLIERGAYLMASSPMQVMQKRFLRQLARANPNPRRCEPGPGQSLSAGKVNDFFEFFQSVIVSRNMYYLNTNLVKPLTEKFRLSYADLAGPSVVEFFCSHFWGSPFNHFVQCIRKHAESATEEWDTVSYWICLFSNNQWEIDHDLQVADMTETPFYKALMADSCKGVCMVLDDLIRPLSRAWCIFEVVCSMKRRASVPSGDFRGLLFCTSAGSLTSQTASGYDVALAIVDKIANLNVQHAEACNQDDKKAIMDVMEEEFGGPEEVNACLKDHMGDVLQVLTSSFLLRIRERKQTIAEQDVEYMEDVGHAERMHRTLSNKSHLISPLSSTGTLVGGTIEAV